MPASQPAASERRTDKMITPEPPKLKTTLKTPPKQATNPLQFVKVGPCALYRTAQEQLQKVEEVKKIKQEVREDPEDWQSNLDNWKSSRRKRQEHIIERVVEVKKLELVEHDRQRRRSKTFSEMMEERGNRGRKMSVGLAVYHEEDANDFSDLGIGTSSGKSSVSGDTHDDAHSVLSDRDSEIEKNHSDVDNAASENGNNRTNATTFENEFHNNRNHNQQEYDSATTATASSPEPEEYTYEGAIRGYVSRVSQNIPRRSLAELDNKVESSSSMSKEKVSKTELSDETKGSPVVKVDILKRREIFEKGSQQSSDGKSSRLSGDFTSSKSIKERLSNLEKQKNDGGSLDKSNKNLNRLSGDMSSIRERLSHLEKKTTEREMKNAKKLVIDSNGELDNVRPLRERLSTLERYSSGDESTITAAGVTVTSRESRHNGDFSVTSIKDRLSALDAARNKEIDKRTVAKHTLAYRDNETRIETSTPSERSSSPDSEYRVPRAPFHRSLDSLDADASSGPDTFERVQSLEELDYTRRYPASSSSTELLNDTDREDSGIHTADVSCSVSQADEPVDDEIVLPVGRQEIIEEKPEPSPNDPETEHTPENVKETHVVQPPTAEPEIIIANNPESATQKETAETSGDLSTNKSCPPRPMVKITTNTTSNALPELPTSPRPIVYQSPRVPPRRTPPETPAPKPKPPCTTDNLNSTSISQKTATEQSLNNNNIEELSDTRSLLRPESESLSDNDREQDTTKSNILQALALNAMPKASGSLTPTPSPISMLPASDAPEVAKVATPLRSPSKIPTPLPRKTVNFKSSPTSSPPNTPTSSDTNAQSKLPTVKVRSYLVKSNNPSPEVEATINRCASPFLDEMSANDSTVSSEMNENRESPKSQIPVSIPQPSTPPAVITTLRQKSSGERRQTVVEVCEKVSVRQGEAFISPPVTPFITVARVGDNEHYEETSASLDIVQESNRVTSPVEIPHLSHDRDLLPEVDHTQNEPAKLASAPEAAASEEVPRPLTLTFGKASLTAEEMEILSPLSPTSKQILTLNLSSDEEIVTSSLAFPLGPPTSVEPPKEKPPPPPADLSDEEGLLVEPLRRLNSTRRIKKELRTRRSDFLGIEGGNDEDLERELTIAKPPDMAAILAEERRVEQLHRRSYDTDSNYEQDSSHERDSGVELGHAEDWNKQTISPDMSQHSRQSSEPFGASVTSSEEDEITKKEREIIEVLEKEEQWRYGNTGEANSDIIGEKLAHKLRELEEEKMQLERERAQEVELRRQEDTLRKNEENIRKQEKALRKREADTVRQEETAAAIAEAERRTAETRCVNEQVKAKEEPEEKERWNAETRPRDSEVRLRTIENQIRDQENKALGTDLGDLSCHEDEYASGEVLRVERELLQLEQEELKRQRSNLAYREQKQQKLAEQLREQWKSMQDVVQAPVNTPSIQFKALPPVNYRSSMPNLEDSQRRKLPPPPIPPAKPLRLVEQRQRDVTIRSSRMPSADSIPQQVDASLRHSASATTLSNHAGQQMTRQTLQALSAAPRPRIVQGDQWVQRRKSDVPRGAQDMNYQHWLIQEAEQRRINEQNLRSPRKVQSYVTGTSVPYSMQCASPRVQDNKPLPDSIIQTLTQRVQNRAQEKPLPPRRRLEHSSSHEHISTQHQAQQPLQPQQQRAQQQITTNSAESQEKMLSVSGKKKCSHCGDELGRGAAMIIESLRLFYHMECFKCCVCHVRLGDGRMGTDVRVRNHKLHCHNCYSSDDGVKFSCV
ncbi:uncharacterized protein CG43427 isoform X1 [Neodiprion virginianus]|uniref:uncharacterized protein CG43427 isoform X1 n=1 Tax=Neodiprion virginianus TaxID=2961670 RepID=UPI001EE73390|nr:uncharacterized protein CG43427 isoform X1 [Neodiprion virginianus]XP_046629018.1 uncharacterized protein CG43427 isoform X1 [Neodiprion virginianus]XP_046629019.1 uncharacterized protein CG43427 isoform X1 [Neodiprion virginianus]